MSEGAPSEHLTDQRTILAVNLAHASMADPHEVPEELWTQLKQAFTEVELVELCFVIGYYRGMQLANVLLDTDVDPDQGPVSGQTRAE